VCLSTRTSSITLASGTAPSRQSGAAPICATSSTSCCGTSAVHSRLRLRFGLQRKPPTTASAERDIARRLRLVKYALCDGLHPANALHDQSRLRPTAFACTLRPEADEGWRVVRNLQPAHCLYTRVSRQGAQRESFADKLDGMSLLASCIDDSYAAKGGSTGGPTSGSRDGGGSKGGSMSHFGRLPEVAKQAD
jgi:hypothetical protein